MIRTTLFLAIVLTALVVAAQDVPTSTRLAARQKTELDKNFTYKGKAVNPRAIKDLTEWINDPLPGPIAIDVGGTYDTNRYFGEYKTREDGFVEIDLTQEYIKEEGSFSYKRIGRLRNGYLVLLTAFWAGGSGVFESILLLQSSVEFEHLADGTRRPQLILRRRGEYSLGDRYGGDIKVDSHHNAIFVGADKRNYPKAFWIRIR